MAETITLNKLKLTDIITFNTFGIGTVSNVVNGKLLGLESGNALRNPMAAAANHANIYSSIPNTLTSPVANDYTKYNYLLIQLVDNTIIEIGEPWINQISLTRLVRQTATIILIDFDSAELQSLTDLLVTNGYLSPSITLS